MAEEQARPETGVKHQVGGHVGAFAAVAPGVIRKKVNPKEFHFYLELHKGGKRAPFLGRAPELRGTSTDADGTKYVHMEDLTTGMHWPSVLDVKVGLQSYAEAEPEEKKRKMRKKDMESTTHSLGMRITGMRVQDVYAHEVEAHGKVWGRAVTEEGTQTALERFFRDGSGKLRREEAAQCASHVAEVVAFMEGLRGVRIYSSSLLFVYDSCPCSIVPVRVRMIDFAHVHSGPDTPDEGYLTGARNLLAFLRAIAEPPASS